MRRIKNTQYTELIAFKCRLPLPLAAEAVVGFTWTLQHMFLEGNA